MTSIRLQKRIIELTKKYYEYQNHERYNSIGHFIYNNLNEADIFPLNLSNDQIKELMSITGIKKLNEFFNSL